MNPSGISHTKLAPLPWVALGLVLASSGCADGRGTDSPPGPLGAVEVVEVTYGPGAGHGQDEMPDLVLGAPPARTDLYSGPVDALSLGEGGRIVLSFGQAKVVDGPGCDLRVFENVFLAAGTGEPYAEVAAVSVSPDGEVWFTFPFDYRAGESTIQDRFVGLAGLRPEGDCFDLAQVGVREAVFVAIRDCGSVGPPDTRLLDGDGEFLDDPGNRCCPGDSQGFDLLGVAAVHWRGG